MMVPPTPELVNGWIALLTPLAVATLTVVNLIVANIVAKRGTEAKDAAKEVKATLFITNKHVEDAAAHARIARDEVKETLALNVNETSDKLAKLQTIANDTHTLVNNNMAIQLRINAVKSRKLADITKDPADIEEAIVAERSLSEHLARQASVDQVTKYREEKIPSIVKPVDVIIVVNKDDSISKENYERDRDFEK